MSGGLSRVCAIAGAMSMVFLSFGCVAIEAGHEGVLVEKQFFFGHGGVDPVPAKTGRVNVALTTKVIDVDIRPIQYSEHFDIISAENAPMSFDAFLIANVIEGRSPELISKYGPNWTPTMPKKPSACSWARKFSGTLSFS